MWDFSSPTRDWSCIERQILKHWTTKATLVLSNKIYYCFQSLNHVWLLATLWAVAHQASLSFTISTVCSNSYLLSWWCYLNISSSVGPYTFCLLSFLASIDIYEILYPNTAEYTLLSKCTWIDQILGHKTSLNRLTRNNTNFFFFFVPEHGSMKLKINYRKEMGKHTNVE